MSEDDDEGVCGGELMMVDVCVVMSDEDDGGVCDGE